MQPRVSFRHVSSAQPFPRQAAKGQLSSPEGSRFEPFPLRSPRKPHAVRPGLVPPNALKAERPWTQCALDVQPWEAAERQLDTIRNRSPLLFQLRPEHAQKFSLLRERMSLASLERSAMANDRLVLMHGEDGGGQNLWHTATTLGDFCRVDDGGKRFVSLSISADRKPSFLDAFLPDGAGPWTEHLMPHLPELPLDLLRAEAGAPQVHANIGLTLSKGRNSSCRYHAHGSNVFLGVHGVKKWLVFSLQDYRKFAEAGDPSPLPKIRSEFAEAMQRSHWDASEHPHMPRPLEFETHPGQVLYLPPYCYHVTYNLTDYTAAMVAVNQEMPPA